MVTARERRALVVLPRARPAPTRTAAWRASIPAARSGDGIGPERVHRLRRLSGGRGGRARRDRARSRRPLHAGRARRARRTERVERAVAGADRGRPQGAGAAAASATRSGSSSGATSRFNPISALTGATLDVIAADPGTRARGPRDDGRGAGRSPRSSACGSPIDVDKRIDGAAEVGAHKTSMLQDLERGRPMEIDALVTAVQELGRLVERRRRPRSTPCWRWCGCGPGSRAATARALARGGSARKVAA